MQLETLEDLREALRAGRVIVISDSVEGVKAHRADCQHVSQDNFTVKVLEHGGRYGEYHAVDSLSEARRLLGAVACRHCAPD